ncbi:DUF397 domain-containing protein [Micromonospora sp. RTP1Z1]|nr:DUF397 domain-containing protein [Micromonospora sp. RTP1Z1]
MAELVGRLNQQPAQVDQHRDSKDRNGPALTFSPAAWTAFVEHTKQS